MIQRRALPVLTHALVVELRRFGGDGDLGRARIRAQTQIDAEHVAIDRCLGQELHEPLHQIDGSTPLVTAQFEGKAFLVVEDDEIDVARIVQLERAVLAHRDHDKTCGGFELGGCFGATGFARIFGEQKTQRAFHAGIGETRDPLGHALERVDAGDVGKRDRERCLPLGDS